MSTLFTPPAPTLLPIVGEEKRFPVNRVFCIGRNYAAHAAEMGMTVDKQNQDPFYFLKASCHVVGNHQKIAFPLETSNLHHEVELVAVLDKPAFQVSEAEALDCVYGYAVGLDLTRRDLQAKAKEKGLPWDGAKNFEDAAVIAEITPKAQVPNIENARISLKINGETRQDGSTSDLIWSLAELIAYLSRFYHLQAGDMIFTGTPEGVSAIQVGDVLVGEIEGLTPLHLTVG
ncbi:MAG: fumarylacetoacetate hydrolase family protein [Pelistega sp.]|nr:fumarylacetoacetate hydrolase family protein [Pelistega sp.]